MKGCFFFIFAVLSFNLQGKALTLHLTINSEALSEKRDITVYLPTSYHTNTTEHYQTLYLLDGESNGELAASMLRRMHLSSAAKGHIVVAIHSTDRLRDYAPTVNRDPRGPVGQGGGGDKFLNFVEVELIPRINKQFRASDFKVLAGHSVAGLLVLHSFHSRPHLFQAHLAFSPAVWWGNRETLIATQNYLTTKMDSNNYLYLNIGNEEGELRQVYNAFAQFMLRNRPVDLRVQVETFDHVGHDLTMAAGMYNAFSGLDKFQKK